MRSSGTLGVYAPPKPSEPTLSTPTGAVRVVPTELQHEGLEVVVEPLREPSPADPARARVAVAVPLAEARVAVARGKVGVAANTCVKDVVPVSVNPAFASTVIVIVDPSVPL